MTHSPQSILILGYGREGQASLPYLKLRHPDARIGVADQNPVEAISGVTMLCGEDYPTDISEWDMIVVSPGIKPSEPLLKTAQNITTATNIFFEDCHGTIIAITGSKGKSTTSSLLAAMLEHAERPSYFVGNIGTPALQTLSQHNAAEALYIYEMSSYQASRLVGSPEVAVVTSLFQAHLDYHGSLEKYYADKMRLTMNQTSEQHLFYCASNEDLAHLAPKSPAQQHPWPAANGVHLDGGTIVDGAGEQVIAIDEIPLLGYHNVSNTMGAISVARHVGIPHDAIANAIRSFQALPHRLQPLGKHRGIIFYNDSISTSPESTIAAINALQNIGIIFLGGSDNGYDFSQLAQVIAERQIPNVVYFPDSGQDIKAAIAATGYAPNAIDATNMKAAVAFAYEHTNEGQIALLSTAAQSYSMYKNFEERGKDFQNEIADQG
jgi:UDP-N-acetylmuramoylalanine--D-glutamate ligase